jgi:hypothetical protein
MIAILIGYGEELEVYRRCRKVWDLYISTLELEGVEIFFVQTKYEQTEDVINNGRDIYIKNSFENGVQHIKNIGANLADALVKSDWTKLGNLETVARQKKVTRWITEKYGEELSHLFFTTITSIHSIEVLKEVIAHLPKTNVYAGMPCVFTEPFMGHTPFIFMSGANTLISQDIAKISYSDHEFDLMGFPNDVWLGLRFVDKQKIYLPRYDIEKNPMQLGLNCELGDEIDAAFEAGHFHIRVKSIENRAHTDHIIMMDVYRKLHLGRRPKLNDLFKLSARSGR